MVLLMITHKQLYQWAIESFDVLRKKKYWKYYLASDEWEDMKIKAATRVISKSGLIDRRFSSEKLRNYVGKSVDNCIKNGIRDFLGHHSLKCTEKRRDLIRTAPISFADKVEEIRPFHSLENILEEINVDLLPFLSVGDRQIYKMMLDGNNTELISLKMGLNINTV